MKNRRGSTLILTLIVFVFLSILATGILSFMVSENKQSIYHKNKIEAYYIARSGAEVTEAAIMGIRDEEEKRQLLSELPKQVTIDNLTFDNGELESVILKKEEGVLIIESTSKAGGSIQKISKALTYEMSSENSFKISGPPIIALKKLGKNIVKKEGDKERYYLVGDVEKLVAKVDTNNEYMRPYEFPKDIRWNGGEGYKQLESTYEGGQLGEKGQTINYVVNGDLTIEDGGDIKILGKVNIFIRAGLKIDNIKQNINTDADSPENLTFFIMGEDKNTNIKLHNQSSMQANIISMSKEINISTQSASEKPFLIGSIYAPKSIINLGRDFDDKNDKSEFHWKGIIIGDVVNLYSQNNNKADEFLERLATNNNYDKENGIEVDLPIGEQNKKIQLSKGYYK